MIGVLHQACLDPIILWDLELILEFTFLHVLHVALGVLIKHSVDEVHSVRAFS